MVDRNLSLPHDHSQPTADPQMAQELGELLTKARELAMLIGVDDPGLSDRTQQRRSEILPDVLLRYAVPRAGEHPRHAGPVEASS